MQKLSVLVWVRLVRVFQKLQKRSMKNLNDLGLTPSEFDILAQAGTHEGASQQQLADLLLVTKGNICQQLDHMEQNGLICRTQDGRLNRIFLTEAGRNLFQTVTPLQEDFLHKLFEPLTDTEQRQLYAILKKLDHSFRAAEALQKKR